MTKKRRQTAKVDAVTARTLRRDAQTLQLREQGLTLDEIAKALGFAGRQGAAMSRDRALERLTEATNELASAERARQLTDTERELVIMNAAEAALLCPPTDDNGNPSLGSVLDGHNIGEYSRLVLARYRMLCLRAKLTGAFAPTKTELTGEGGGAIKIDVRAELLAQLSGRAPGGAPGSGTPRGDRKPDGGGR